MNGMRVYVEGVGLWSPALTDFAALQACLEGGLPASTASKPPAALLPPNERRRAPESVLLAIEVASQAVAMSGRDAATLASVFSSSHGDQPITDYMCTTLARAPQELSPTRFHNSVHNAAAGYWTIATGCHAPSTAVCAYRASFGAGLLEAAGQVVAEGQPVLLVCSDTAGSGFLLQMTGYTQPFGCALLLAPDAGPATLAQLDLAPTPASMIDSAALDEPLAGWCKSNASAAGLPLLALLAGNGGCCRVAASDALELELRVERQ